MSHPVALFLLLALAPVSAQAVETMRIAMSETPDDVRVRGRDLLFGPDSEEGPFVRLAESALAIRRRGNRLEVNGAPWPDSAVRFRSGADLADAGVPGHESIRANDFEVRGDVVVRIFKDRLQLINVIPLEDYLAAVLGGEMPVSFPLEALKAQAVAARTYALQRKLETYSNAFHLGSSVLHQVYKGVNREDAKTRAAVLATRGEVLTHELAPIEAYFHASCGGRTESGRAALQRDLPYLQPVECPCGPLGVTRWSAVVPDGDLSAVMRHRASGLRVSSRTDTGRVSRVATDSGPGMEAVTLRQRLGYTRLKSLKFEVERVPGGYRFNGHGYGHGAGLCQWGAKVLSDQGQSYREILQRYYPGAELQQLY